MLNETSITNREEVIDSREILARIAALRDLEEGARERVEELKEERAILTLKEDAARISEIDEELTHVTTFDGVVILPPDFTEKDSKELQALEALAEQAKAYRNWTYGETLIRYSHFEEYTRELAEDIATGKADLFSKWPYSCIDWQKAADDLKVDYAELDFDGVPYLMRA